jgi:8-oxo-dGTP diphosphatase
MNSVPVFGTRLPGVKYQYRPCAYALVRNAEGNFAVAQTPVACFLPGGGIDAGETPEQTVEREGQEECGLVLRSMSCIGQAIEICYSISDACYYEKDSIFLTARIIGNTTASESDHQLLWLSPEKAIEALSHESHRWAVQGLLGHNQI